MSKIILILPTGIFFLLIFLISTIPTEAFYNDFSQPLLFLIVTATYLVIANMIIKTFD